MKAVIQRVRSASVTIGDETAGEIGEGLLVLLGIAAGDEEADARYFARKVANLRVFEDEGGRMNRSVRETGGAVLLVSQFTLYADCRKGRRPSFAGAARPERGKELYELLISLLREEGVPVATGRFGEKMLVKLANDGPVTIIIDTEDGRKRA